MSFVEGDYRHTCSAELYALIIDGNHSRSRSEELLDFLSQCSRSFSVDNADRMDAEHDGIVYIMHHVLQRLAHSLAPHVEFHLEVQFPFRERTVYH